MYCLIVTNSLLRDLILFDVIFTLQPITVRFRHRSRHIFISYLTSLLLLLYLHGMLFNGNIWKRPM